MSLAKTQSSISNRPSMQLIPAPPITLEMLTMFVKKYTMTAPWEYVRYGIENGYREGAIQCIILFTRKQKKEL